MSGLFDKIKAKAEETLHDQQKMDMIKGKVQDTLHDQQKMDMIKSKAEGLLDKVTHHDPEAEMGRVDHMGAEYRPGERMAGEYAGEAPISRNEPYFGDAPEYEGERYRMNESEYGASDELANEAESEFGKDEEFRNLQRDEEW